MARGKDFLSTAKEEVSASSLEDKTLSNLHTKSHDKSLGIPQSRKAACGESWVSQQNKQLSPMTSAFWKRNKDNCTQVSSRLLRQGSGHRKPVLHPQAQRLSMGGGGGDFVNVTMSGELSGGHKWEGVVPHCGSAG